MAMKQDPPDSSRLARVLAWIVLAPIVAIIGVIMFLSRIAKVVFVAPRCDKQGES
jgi:hypothetical protein